MHPVLSNNLYFVKEHVGLFKAASNYDVLDPKTQAQLIHCREPTLGPFTKLLRFTDFKRMTPFNVVLTTPEGKPVLRVERGVSLFVSRVKVYDNQDEHVGGFKQKFFSIGGSFRVFDSSDHEVCVLKGKWTSWEFRFLQGERELARVSKKWSGLGKELFTSADNYILNIDDAVAPNDRVRMLIMAAVMCIDMVLKE